MIVIEKQTMFRFAKLCSRDPGLSRGDILISAAKSCLAVATRDSGYVHVNRGRSLLPEVHSETRIQDSKPYSERR